MASLGWGHGFYGPSIYLLAVIQRTGWTIEFVSLAVTLHFLAGAIAIPVLPSLHKRFGVGSVATAGAVVTVAGIYGWAIATERWQLLACACLSGIGWITNGAVAVNAVISSWFDKDRPSALSRAYNGASVGGFVFAPLWSFSIHRLGFPIAVLVIGSISIVVIALLSALVFRIRPGSATPSTASPETMADGQPRSAAPIRLTLKDGRLATLTAAMSLGLFAQIGLLAHFVSLSAPVVGAQPASAIAGTAALLGLVGRAISTRFVVAGRSRRAVAAASYGVQALGTLILIFAPINLVTLALAASLFGLGIGNATSLPPLIAQADFPPDQVQRVVARIVATGQASYSIAPASLAVLLPTYSERLVAMPDATTMLGAVLGIQLLASATILAWTPQIKR